MAQILVPSVSSLGSAAGTTFAVIGSGSGQFTNTEANLKTTWRAAGTFNNLYVHLSANTMSSTVVARYRVGGANGNQVVTIASGGVGEFTDTTNSDTVAAGNQIDYSLVGTGTGAFTKQALSMFFAASVSTVNKLTCNAGSGITDTSLNTTYYNPLGGKLSLNTTEANAQFKNKIAATLQNLFVEVSANTASVATVTSRIGGVGGNLSISIGSGVTGVIEDTTHTDSLNVNDLVNSALNSTVTTTFTVTNIAFDYLTTTLNTLYMAAQALGGDTINKSVFAYIGIASQFETSPTESNKQLLAGLAFTSSFMEANVSANTITATTTITFRKNAADGNMSLSYGSGANGYLEDSTHTDSVIATDEINYKVAPGATGTSISIVNIGILALYPEAITVDKWMPSFPDIVRAPAPPLLRGRHDVGPINKIFPENVFLDKWLPYCPDFTRVAPHARMEARHDVGAINKIFTENIFPDKWMPSYPERTRAAQRALEVRHDVGPINKIFTENILPDKWMPEIEPLRRDIPQISVEENTPTSIFLVVATTSIDKWIPTIADFTRRSKQPLSTGHFVSAINKIFTENIFPDKWMPSFPDFVRKAARALDTGHVVSALSTTFKETINFDKWGPVFADFTRKLPRALDTGFNIGAISTVFQENIVLTKWIPQFVDFARKPLRALDTGYFVSAVNKIFPENVFPDKWMPTFADFTRKPLRALDAGHIVGALSTTFKELVNLDKWLPNFADFTRRAARALDTGWSVGAVATEFHETVNFDKWAPEYPAFTRRPKRALDTGYTVAALHIVFPETAGYDKWGPEYPDFTRRMRRALDTGWAVSALDTFYGSGLPVDKWAPRFPDFTRRSPVVADIRELAPYDFDSHLNMSWLFDVIGRLVRVRKRNRTLSPDAKNVIVSPKHRGKVV